MAVSFRGATQCPIVFGNNAVTQNLLTIENKIGSRVNVNIRRLTIQLDPITALTTVMPQIKVARATAISGGVLLDKSKFNTSQTSDAFVLLRSAAEEGSAITATAGDTIWQQYASRLHTAVEQVLGSDKSLLPRLVADAGKEFKLRPGESLLAYITGSSVASNSAISNSWLANVVIEEDEIATFAISGTVTLSAAPVAGAKVMVMESDDIAGTNMFLREVLTTGAGGTWSSSILTGKVGSAFVQYEAGGTYYTAPGSPYLQ
jgi:hypothetical protein